MRGACSAVVALVSGSATGCHLGREPQSDSGIYTGGACSRATALGDAGLPLASDAASSGLPRDAPPTDRRTCDFAINRFILDPGDEPPGGRGVYGFNLDGRFSPSRIGAQVADDCAHGDYFSVVDPDENRGRCADGAANGGSACEGGVDNQYPNLAATLAQLSSDFGIHACLTDTTERGRGLILLRVSEVDGTLGASLNDPEVVVRIYPRAFPLFASCGELGAHNRPYAVEEASLLVAGDPGSARLRLAGSSLIGRLRVANLDGPTLPLALGFGVTNDLRALQLRVSLSEVGGTLGNLGGLVDLPELVDTLAREPSIAPLRDAVGPLLQGFVDLPTPMGSPRASCDSPFGSVAIGLAFSAVRASIVATAAGPTAGMCGSGASR